jgi:transposase
MAPIDDAIAAYDAQELGENLSYRQVAKMFGVSVATLRRRQQGSQQSRATKDLNQRALSPQQERVLLQHVDKLTERRLPPTRDMMRNFASIIAHQEISESWVSKWSKAMDAVRHHAESYLKYKLCFDLCHEKMAQYNIQACNTYNMDEKGFMLGILGRSKRIFDKRMWEKKELTAALQDGEREWVSCLATICADGSALPPGLIFAALGGLRDTWVESIQAGIHEVFIATSPTGWSNNEIGLAWLEQVFQRYTKEKAKRDYRLLIVDGHGSHLTMDFINYCDSHRIILAILPPHSTHTLQPLDVVMFKPLSSAYSKALTNHLQTTQGLIPINKTDFFPLFWQAWVPSFKDEAILKAWEATGIWPQEAEHILKRFNHEPHDKSEASEDSLAAIEGNFQ